MSDLKEAFEKWSAGRTYRPFQVVEWTLEHLSKNVEFETPDVGGSDFHDLVINQSIPHGNREDPAWMYAIKDAVVGARWQFDRDAARIEVFKLRAKALDLKCAELEALIERAEVCCECGGK